jgi:capsular exopolysaccharide synthesis family protein
LKPVSPPIGQPPRVVAPAIVSRAAASAPAADDGGFSLSFFVGVFCRWWKLLVPLSLLLMLGASAAVMTTFEPMYRARGRLEFAPKLDFVFQGGGGKSALFYNTQVELLRSPQVLTAVLQNKEIAKIARLAKSPDPVAWLSLKGLEIEQVNASEYFDVAFADPDPDAAAALVNAVLNEYFRVRADRKHGQANHLLELLRNEKAVQENEIKRLRERVRVAQKLLPDDVPLAGTEILVANNPTQDLSDKLMQAELQFQTIKARVESLEQTIQDDDLVVPDAIVQAALDNAVEIQQLRLHIQQKQSKQALIEMTSAHGAKDAAYIRMQAEIERDQSLLEARRSSLRPMIVNQVVASTRMDREQELSGLRTEFATALQQRNFLSNQLERIRADLTEKGDARMDFNFAQQELQRGLQLFSLISDRVAQMETEMKAPDQVYLAEPAKAPAAPLAALPLMELGISLASGLLLPFALICLWEGSVRRISNVEQLEATSPLQVVGEIARLPARKRNASLGTRVVSREVGLFEESIDSLRTSLLLANENEQTQVLAVASAISGEGKTSIASQLAVSIARATGQPVLLIDGDMRAPDIHKIFDLPLGPGLAEVLDRKVSLEDAINRAWSEHLHILPAGELHMNPHKLIGSESFEAMLNEVRLWYRYIIIDTPPVLAASESLVIARHADSTLLCAMRDHSRENHLKLAYRRLLATGAKAVGVVFSGVPSRYYAYRYGAYGAYAYVGSDKGRREQ